MCRNCVFFCVSQCDQIRKILSTTFFPKGFIPYFVTFLFFQIQFYFSCYYIILWCRNKIQPVLNEIMTLFSKNVDKLELQSYFTETEQINRLGTFFCPCVYMSYFSCILHCGIHYSIHVYSSFECIE